MAGGVGAQLRRQHAPVARDGPFERGLGAAGRRRRRHRARRRAARRPRARDDRARRCRPPASAAAGQRRRARGRAAHARGVPYERPDDIADGGRPTCSPTTASSPGSRAAASSGPRALGHRSPARRTRGRRRTSSGSTTSRAASSSGRSRRWCSPSGPPRSSTGRCPSPYMLFVHDVRDGVARSDPGRRPRRRHRPRRRPSTRPTSRWSPRLLDAFERRTGAAGRRQHQPQHRRPADGRRPARRAGVFGSAPVDLLALGPFVVRRPTCRPMAGRAAARHLRAREALRDGRPGRRWRDGGCGRRPDARPAQPRGPARARSPTSDHLPARSCSWTTGRTAARQLDVDLPVLDVAAPDPAGTPACGWRVGTAEVRRTPATWGGRRVGAPGSSSSTTTSCPEPAGLSGCWTRPRRCRGPDVGRCARRASDVPLPGRPASDRLGTRRPRGSSGRRLGHGGHGLSPRGAARGRRASTSASRGPTARTPTSRCASAAAGCRLTRGRHRVTHPVRPSEHLGQPAPAGAATPTTR